MMKFNDKFVSQYQAMQNNEAKNYEYKNIAILSKKENGVFMGLSKKKWRNKQVFYYYFPDNEILSQLLISSIPSLLSDKPPFEIKANNDFIQFHRIYDGSLYHVKPHKKLFFLQKIKSNI